jgi:hypothetical protein
MSDTGGPGGQASTEPRVLVYPSATLRPVPSFLFAAPAGWVVDEVPDALAVIRTPEQVADFWVNATLSHDRVGKAVDIEKAAQATWARIQRESPEAKLSMERMARFGSNVVYLRGIELPAPQSGRPLAQLQALLFAPPVEGAKTNDFFQIICTAPSDQMTNFGPIFVALISSFQFA